MHHGHLGLAFVGALVWVDLVGTGARTGESVQRAACAVPARSALETPDPFVDHIEDLVVVKVVTQGLGGKLGAATVVGEQLH